MTAGPGGRLQEDERLMARALELAATADFATSPNPMVGALVVRHGRVAGMGATSPPGGPHAEVHALRDAGEAARGATLYVTLEPCSHQGRTPPCVGPIIEAGIGRCVVAMTDPNPRVDGAGIAALRRAGIEVDIGILESRARRLNQFYVRWVASGLPFVTAKFAMSLDGRIATHDGESKWITSEPARAHVQILRHQHDVIMVGANTVARDDPNLTTRLPGGGGRQPLRVVLDSRLRVPIGARIFTAQTGEVLVATSDRARGDRIREFEAAGIPLHIFPAREGRVGLGDVLRHVAAADRISVLVEGGSAVLGSAFDAGLVDRVVAVIAPRVIGGSEAPAAVGGHGVDALAAARPLRDVEVERVGPDIVVTGYCVHDTPHQDGQ